MLIVFTCRQCNTGIEASSAVTGSRVTCPFCHTVVAVPLEELGAGSRIGGFLIKEMIGRGGMGEVYLARQLSMDRDVAIKVLPRHLTHDKGSVDRFLNEVRMTARLEHPNIVTAHETGEDDGLYFLAMSYVRGEELDEKLQREGAMPEKKALGLIRKIAMALAYAWTEHRLLHRDIKPSNIIIDKSGEPKLMDMGLSKSLKEGTVQTVSTMVMGTPNYMSPEQAEGGTSLDFRSDMYSLGVTLYHMLTGKVPYEGSSIVEVLRKQVSEALPDPRTFNPSISEGCVVLLESMLAKNPDQRHAGWDEWLADVDRVLAGKAPRRKASGVGHSALHRSQATGLPVAEHSKIVLHRGDVQKMLEVRPHDPPEKPVKPVKPVKPAAAPAPDTAERKQGRRFAWLIGGTTVAAAALIVMLQPGQGGSSRKPSVAQAVPAQPAPVAPSAVSPHRPLAPVATTVPVPSPGVSKPAAEIQPRVSDPVKPPSVSPVTTPSKVTPTGPEGKEQDLIELNENDTVVAGTGSGKPAGQVLPAVVPASGPAVPAGGMYAGLVLYFSFDQPPSNSAVPDLSGMGNHGVATNVAWMEDGRHGGAFVFGLSNSCVLVQNSPSLGLTNVSVLAWIQSTNPDDQWRRIVDKCYNKGFALSRGGSSVGQLGKLVWEDSAGPRCGSETSLCDGQWHHVAGVFDGTNSILYIDGKEQAGRKKAVNPPSTNAYPLAVGTSRSLAGGDQLRSFDGAIDEVMVFDRALTPAEVAMFHGSPHSLVRMQEAEAARDGQSKQESALALLADHLLRQDFPAARRQVETGGALASLSDADGAGMREMVTRVAAMPEVLLASFRQAEGREETIQFKVGAEQLRIVGVDGDRILAQRVIRAQGKEVGFAQRDFALTDTSAQEQLRRLGAQKAPDRDIMRGLLAYQGQSPDLAKKYFEQSGHRLGLLLWQRIDAIRERAKTAREESARMAQDKAAATLYAALLRSAGFPAMDMEPGKLRLAILRKKYNGTEIDLIRNNLAAFQQSHGKSRFAGEHGPVLDALGKVIPDIPLCVDRETVDRAVAKFKVVNGGNVTVIVDVQEEGIRVQAPKNPYLYDLSPLTGLPIVTLNLRDCRVLDLKPLLGMPLRELDLYNCPAWDLSPLKGAPLVSLTAGFDPSVVKYDKVIPDLNPLRGMPLEKLSLFNCFQIKDLSPMKGMPLKYLHMNRASGVEDLRPLKELPLERLELYSSKAYDLSPLAETPLKYLSFSYATVSTLSGFEDFRIESLALDFCGGAFDLAAVKHMPLKTLSIRGTEVRNRDLLLKGIPGLRIIDK